MPKKSKSTGDARKKAEQTNFESAVKNLRDKHKQSNIVKTSEHFRYGKDPQKKNSNLGRRKVLHRLCGKDINEFRELKDYVPSPIKFNYCIMAKEESTRCINMNEYTFEMKNSFNLSDQLIKALYSHSLPTVFEDGMTSYLITPEHKDCILQVDTMQFYIRTITQDVLSSDMEARQNEHRVSYGPVILVEINEHVIMRVKCDRIGIGYYDLVNHKLGNCPSHGCIHKIINIHQNFLKDVYIDFGIKNNYIANVPVSIAHKKLTEYNGRVRLLNINEFKPVNMNVSNNGSPYGCYHNGSGLASSVRYNPLLPMQPFLNKIM